jgi:Family of unknown function (DUF5972)
MTILTIILRSFGEMIVSRKTHINIPRFPRSFRREVKMMRTYERPTMRECGSFTETTGFGVNGPADLIFIIDKT